MRFLYAWIACCVAASRLGSFAAAEVSEEHRFGWQQRLAVAHRFYEDGDWLLALRSYRGVRAEHADLPNDDETCFRIALCSELAIPMLESLMPARLDAEWVYGRKVMTWLRDTYGYYVEVSEGAAWWVYDKRALRELLRLHPRSGHADEAEYVLVKYELVYLKRDPIQICEAYPEAVGRYERLLERYPNANLRPTVLEELAFLKDPGGDHSESVRHYWSTAAFRYP
jgi:hypothetical protein